MWLIALLVSVAGSVALAIGILELTVMPPPDAMRELILFMTTTGVGTVLLTFILYRRGATQWFTSLRWTLLTLLGLTVALIFVNVYLAASRMYISEYDLALTAALLTYAGLLSFVAVFFMSRTLTQRIHALVGASQRIAKGDLHTRLPVVGKDELATLARSFNQMADALDNADQQKQALEDSRRHLIAWISHDLRTPLATIRVMNEAIVDGVTNDPQTVARYMTDMQREIHHLGRLIDDLFELSQLEAGRLTLKREPTSVHDLISDTIGSLKTRAQQQRVELTGMIEGQVNTVPMAADKIQRVLYNLIDNAMRFTPPGGQITLKAARLPDVTDKVQISVHNTGSTIATTDLPHIFKSFYQGEPSRALDASKRRGAGLGLAIARGFVEAHGGEIWVQSQQGQGTTFYFTLSA
jgi:signal transduction histidine kinase